MRISRLTKAAATIALAFVAGCGSFDRMKVEQVALKAIAVSTQAVTHAYEATAERVEDGTIEVETARTVGSALDGALTALEGARSAVALGQIDDAGALIDAASRSLVRASDATKKEVDR